MPEVEQPRLSQERSLNTFPGYKIELCVAAWHLTPACMENSRYGLDECTEF